MFNQHSQRRSIYRSTKSIATDLPQPAMEIMFACARKGNFSSIMQASDAVLRHADIANEPRLPRIEFYNSARSRGGKSSSKHQDHLGTFVLTACSFISHPATDHRLTRSSVSVSCVSFTGGGGFEYMPQLGSTLSVSGRRAT